MPGYGILDEKSGKGLLPWSWAVERLENAKRYWLATTRPDMEPYNDPVTVVRPTVVFGHYENFRGEDGFTQTATRWTFGRD